MRPTIVMLAAMLVLWGDPGLADIALLGHPSVIDGDTIEIHGTRIRFYGIDAPESRQLCQDASGHDYRCGQKAAFALADHIGSSPVSCQPKDTDRYGRTVAVCYLGSEDLNAWMVAHGWAMAYRHYSTAYVPQEDAAHAAGLGIWAGAFMAPWDWRARERGETTTLGPSTPVPEAVNQQCCKVCTTGKACGDSCIRKSKQCHKGPGCACDAQ